MKELVQYLLESYRRERQASHEAGHSNPLPPRVEEGGLVDPYFPQAEDTELVLFDLATLNSKHDPKDVA